MAERKSRKILSLKEVAHKAGLGLAEITGRKLDGITGVHREEEGWLILVELVEKDTPTSISDVLGTYEVRVDEQGNVIDYERKELRQRIPALGTA